MKRETAAVVVLLGLALASCSSSGEGQGGSDGTSSATGSVDPNALPDEGRFALVQRGANWRAAGSFDYGAHRCTNDDGTEAEELAVGSCAIRRCSFPYGEVSAGRVTVTGTDRPVEPIFDEHDAVCAAEGAGQVFNGADVSFFAEGDVVPAFSGSLPSPPVVTNLAILGEDVVISEPGQDLTLAWNSSEGTGSLFVRLARGLFADDSDSDEAYPAVHCRFDVRAGRGVVPYGLMAAHPDLEPGSIEAQVVNTSVVAAGTFRVTLSAERWVGEARWRPLALVCDTGLSLTPTYDYERDEDDYTVYDASVCLTTACCEVVRACADSDACLGCFGDAPSSPLCDPVLACIDEHCERLFPREEAP